MAKIGTEVIDLIFMVKFRLTFWDAIKFRIARIADQELLDRIVKVIAADTLQQ